MILDRNHSEIKQPDNTTRFQLNVCTDPEHKTSVVNEKGTVLCVDLPAKKVGSITIDREREVYFCEDNSIQLIDTEQCTITELVRLSDFNFDINYPITGMHRVMRGCESIVYFFDHKNKDRFINIDRLEKHKTEGVFDIKRFEFNPESEHPLIEREILDTGGKLQYGTYNFAVEYLNENNDSLYISPVDINYTPIITNFKKGALNISTSLADIGGRPLSSQSIKLKISRIPDYVSFLRVIAFRHITSDGFTSDAHAIGDLIPVSQESVEYVYRGFSTDNGDFLVDKNQYLVPKAIYQSSLNGIQVNNICVRYNLKETVRDYSSYQRYASKICCKYVVNKISKDEKKIYLLNNTFAGGEIILPCINYVHADGTVSNSFPLIGRPKTADDAQLVDDVFSTGQVEKWKLYDTSVKDLQTIQGFESSGQFGYYESDEKYINPPNYCENDYWGEDCEGNSLTDTNVRLFVVPDRSKERMDSFNQNSIFPIGIWFDETTVEYPDDDVVGHYFSIVISNDSNIVAKGLSIESEYLVDDDVETLKTDGKYITTQTNMQGTPSNVPMCKFISGESDIQGKYLNGTHFVSEASWVFDKDDQYEDDVKYDDIFDKNLPYDTLNIDVQKVTAQGHGVVTQEIRSIDNALMLPPKSVSQNRVNNSITNTILAVELPSRFNESSLIKYVSIRNNINPVPNIWSLRTRRITELNGYVSFKGDFFICPLDIDNIGGISIDEISLEDIAKAILLGGFFGSIFNRGILGLFSEGSDIQIWAEYIRRFNVESRVNTYLRHGGSDTCNDNVQANNNYHNVFFNKVAEVYKEKFKMKDSICPFFPGYNEDYSYISELNKYFNIGVSYDFCSECTGLYPNRMIYSLKSFSEDLSDLYRVNRPNDYVDIPSEHGDIIAVDYVDNRLMVRTKGASYVLIPNAQQMELSETSVQIGTGDFLSIPAQEMRPTKIGFGGQQHKLDSINCEKGLFWVDKEKGEIYRMAGEFNVISSPMERWFDMNLSGDLIMTYDKMHNRVIITNKEKWTLSYCLEYNGWKSFHSYIPEHYIYNGQTFLAEHDTKLWKFGTDEKVYTKYFNLEFPAVVEFIVKDFRTFNAQSVLWHSNTYLIEGYQKDVRQITFDEMICYNDTQTTGVQKLEIDDDTSVFYDNLTTHVKLTDRNYKASPLKDLSLSNEIWSTDISSVKQGTQGYMDKIPVIGNPSQVEQADFKSKWIGVRLYFNNHEHKIAFEYADTLKLYSIR
jgi:YHS domain-containing protein